MIRAFVGHGVGRSFHSDPQVFHYDNPAARGEILPGMTFTIEPMISIGDWHHEMWDDGWTAVTADRSAPRSSSTRCSSPTTAPRC